MTLKQKLRLVVGTALALLLSSCVHAIVVRFVPTKAREGTFSFSEQWPLIGRSHEVTLHCIGLLTLRDATSGNLVWSERRQNQCVDKANLRLGEHLQGYGRDYQTSGIVSGRPYVFSISAHGAAGEFRFTMP